MLHCTFQSEDMQDSAWAGLARLGMVFTSGANRLIGEVVQTRRRPLLGPSPG